MGAGHLKHSPWQSGYDDTVEDEKFLIAVVCALTAPKADARRLKEFRAQFARSDARGAQDESPRRFRFWISTYAEIDPALSMGGYKQSGLGREMGAEPIEAFTQTKSVLMRLGG